MKIFEKEQLDDYVILMSSEELMDLKLLMLLAYIGIDESEQDPEVSEELYDYCDLIFDKIDAVLNHWSKDE